MDTDEIVGDVIGVIEGTIRSGEEGGAHVE